MTIIKFVNNKQGIVGFEAKGHTGFADPGEDIVCAAISVLVQTTIIGLKDVLHLNIAYKIDDGYLKCRLPEKLTGEMWQQSQLIIKVLYRGLQEILTVYGSKYLRIEEVELCK